MYLVLFCGSVYLLITYVHYAQYLKNKCSVDDIFTGRCQRDQKKKMCNRLRSLSHWGDSMRCDFK